MKEFLVLSSLAAVLACGSSAGAPGTAPGEDPSREMASEEVASEGVPSQPGEEVVESPGAVVRVGSFGFGLVPAADTGTRYAPTKELAEEFRVDGLPVVFSGVVEESPRGARLWGTPLRVTAIRRMEQ